MGKHFLLTLRPQYIFIATLLFFTLVNMQDVLAQSSLGIGRSEQTVPTGGFFEGFFQWVRSQQADFHRSITEILVSMRKHGTHFWSLVWICFLYGVFHAVGPGHGKVVISSYMLANEVVARRGIYLSFAASIMQGVTAILAISVFMLALRGIIKSADLAYGLEIASYIGVMAVGLWLIWRKLSRMGWFNGNQPQLAGHEHHVHSHDHEHHHHAHNHQHHDHHTHSHAHAHDHHHDHSHDHHHHDHGVCDTCGHSHAPDPSTLSGDFGLREVWSAILAVGLRPCTGALIVLVFCFANGLFLAGIVATLAMSIGTGLAVSSMALLAVTAKNAALKLSGAQNNIGWIYNGIEVFGAVLIFVIGFVLFTAAISS